MALGVPTSGPLDVNITLQRRVKYEAWEMSHLQTTPPHPTWHPLDRSPGRSLGLLACIPRHLPTLTTTSMIRITIETDKTADLLELLEALRETTYADTSAEGSYQQIVAGDEDDDDDDTPDEFRVKSMGFDLSGTKSHL